jgi:hypothetical protein
MNMTLDQYLAEWESDAVFDLTELDKAARQVPILHAKWWRFYSHERLKHRALDIQSKLLIRQKWEWYMGKLDDEERKTLGWPVWALKVYPTNIQMYMDADTQIQDLAKRKALQEETLKFLEDVVKSINNRNFAISNAINWTKFKMGM